MKREIGYNAWYFRRERETVGEEIEDVDEWGNKIKIVTAAHHLQSEEEKQRATTYGNSSGSNSSPGPNGGGNKHSDFGTMNPSEHGPFTLYEMWDKWRRYELEPHTLVRMMNIRQDFALRDVWPQWDAVFRLPDKFVTLEAAEKMVLIFLVFLLTMSRLLLSWLKLILGSFFDSVLNANHIFSTKENKFSVKQNKNSKWKPRPETRYRS